MKSCISTLYCQFYDELLIDEYVYIYAEGQVNLISKSCLTYVGQKRKDEIFP